MVDVYADEGITGTRMDRRDEFLRLLHDAQRGKLDEVLVKSISRFARNTRDCLAALRELSLLGVTVRFDKENLNTETLTTELMVSVSGSLAQEESISMSENMRWSYQKRMQSGKFITCKAPFGYRLHGKEMTVYEEEAEIVRWVFDSYLAGMNTVELAEALTTAGIPTSEGNPVWNKSGVSYMLQNEKYIGDALSQKYMTTQTIPFKRQGNKGQLPRYYAEGTHPAIIDRDTFDRVQELIQSRRPKSAGISGTYPLTRKMRCACCGATFMRRVTKSGIAVWGCRTHDKSKDACPMGRIPETEIYAAFMRMAAKLKAHSNIVLAPAISQLQELAEAENRENGDMLGIAKEIAALNEQNLILNRLREKNLIPTDSFLQKNAQISARLAELKRQRRMLLEAGEESGNTARRLKEQLHILKNTDLSETFDEQLFAAIVETVMADSQEQIRFRLLGDLELEERIEGKLR